MSAATMVDIQTELTGERADILRALANARNFLRHTALNLTEEQAREASTVSTLTVGGLIKHVTSVEDVWARFMIGGPSVMPDLDILDWANIPPEVEAEFAAEFALGDDESLAGALERYAEVAARTDAQLATVDLDYIQPLPRAPWFTETEWSVRRAFLHIIGETTQHAGHADIIRETIDGQKTMG